MSAVTFLKNRKKNNHIAQMFASPSPSTNSKRDKNGKIKQRKGENPDGKCNLAVTVLYLL